VQLREAVGDLLRVDEQLEAVSELWIGVAPARERRDLGGEVGDKGRLYQLLLGERLEQHELQRAPPLVLLVLHAVPVQLLGEEGAVAQIALHTLLTQGFGDRKAGERLAQLKRLSLVGQR